MPLQVDLEPDMDEDDIRISVVDVYDLATEIGKEFEKIIDCFGADAVTSLMPKVISALEQLEKLATRHESTSSYIQELRTNITQLETEKIGKKEDRQRYERELEEIEDRLREESHELVAMVSRLQDENRKLSTSLNKSEGTVIHSNGAAAEVDMKVVSHLQEIIDAQREQLRKQEQELRSKAQEQENLTSQLEKLNILNREHRRRQRNNAAQMRSLIDERAELQARLQEEQRAGVQLRQRLGLAQKENEDLASVSTECPDLSNKLVFDRDDPNRPRFTMTELKEILYERNELKARVSDLEDELEMYRPKTARQQSHIICPPLEMAEAGTPHSLEPLTPPLSLSDSLSTELQTVDDADDAPVQGPLPYEPDDAPWKKEESGIRKFFRRLFGDGETSPGGTPKRGLLSLNRP
ncbi:rab interacting lysosomal protein like isoform X2 [Oratosquilla oratoria]|uniref:rab interacting lysosomal protein like isoform X2 n=1 Tax=Oratosquilla oratoria TaxID=337810 RepID=UPI003F759E1A